VYQGADVIEDRYLLTSVPEEYRPALYAFWHENSALNTEAMWDGPTWLKWFKENVERPSRLDTL
jgi:hypothetical protein